MHRRTQEPLLDALRGLAVFGVLLTHTRFVCDVPRILVPLVDAGARGVQLFYLVSALTLAASLECRSASESHPLRNYALRRAFRIMPMYYVAIGIYLAMAGPGISVGLPPSTVLWTNLTFVFGLHPVWINGLFPGAWSIAVEVSFYVLLPFLLPRVRTVNAAVWLTLIVVATSRLLTKLANHALPELLPNVDPAHLRAYTFLWLPAQAPLFALGLLVHRLRSASPNERPSPAALLAVR